MSLRGRFVPVQLKFVRSGLSYSIDLIAFVDARGGVVQHLYVSCAVCPCASCMRLAAAKVCDDDDVIHRKKWTDIEKLKKR